MSFMDAYRQARAAAEAKNARYCTKHLIVKSVIPGGPDRFTWIYFSRHRTPGNQCDGPLHRRAGGWW